MSEIEQLGIGIGIDASDVDRKLKGLQSSFSRLGGTLQNAFSFAVGGLMLQGVNRLGNALGNMWTEGLEGAREAQAVAREQAQVLEATGGAAGMTADELNNLATELSRATGRGDEFISSGNNMLLTFKNIGEQTFPRASAAMLDFAQFMGTDARSAAVTLGKALNDPTKGLTALGRAGVTFTEQQKEQIKAMQAAGDLAGAQSIVLGELEAQFGGVAAAAATDSLKLSNAWGELLEVAGGFGLVLKEQLAERALPLVMRATELLPGALEWVGEAFEDIAYTLRPAMRRFGELATVFKNNLPRAIQQLKDAWNTLRQSLNGDWVDSDVIAPLARVSGVAALIATKLAEGDLQGAFDTIKPYAESAFDAIKTIVGDKLAEWQPLVVEKLQALGTTIYNNLPTGFQTFVDNIMAAADDLRNGDIAGALANFMPAGWADVIGGAAEKVGAFAVKVGELIGQVDSSKSIGENLQLFFPEGWVDTAQRAGEKIGELVGNIGKWVANNPQQVITELQGLGAALLAIAGMQGAVTVINGVAGAVNTLKVALLATNPLLATFAVLITLETAENLAPESTIGRVAISLNDLQAALLSVAPLLAPVTAAIGALGLAAGLAASVTGGGGLIAMGAALAALALPIAVVMGALALLKLAWDRDWQNIATNSTRTWNEEIKPMLENMGKFLMEDMPRYFAAIAEGWRVAWQAVYLDLFVLWHGQLLPLLRGIKSFIDDLAGAWNRFWGSVQGAKSFTGDDLPKPPAGAPPGTPPGAPTANSFAFGNAFSNPFAANLAGGGDTINIYPQAPIDSLMLLEDINYMKAKRTRPSYA